VLEICLKNFRTKPLSPKLATAMRFSTACVLVSLLFRSTVVTAVKSFKCEILDQLILQLCNFVQKKRIYLPSRPLPQKIFNIAGIHRSVNKEFIYSPTVTLFQCHLQFVLSFYNFYLQHTQKIELYTKVFVLEIRGLEKV